MIVHFAEKMVRSSLVRNAALTMAAIRGRRLVLLYHRVRAKGACPNEVVPTVSQDLFRRQLECLLEIGEIVSLEQLLRSHPDRRLRFAITFDDDEPAHLHFALPVLRRLGIPATFFLSGRNLHGLGDYWWRLLEYLIMEQGIERTREKLGLSGATPAELAAQCESEGIAGRIERLVPEIPAVVRLDAGSIRALAEAGMEVGFHTLTHPVLTRLSDREISRALAEGRKELEVASGAPVRFLAYPHGKADGRVARLAEAAGYEAAFRAAGRPIEPESNRFLLGRWEPGSLEPAALLRGIALRMNRPVGA